MNQVTLMGRVTKDLEIRTTQSGTATVKFNIAIDRGKDKEGNSRGADFPNMIAFGKTAESIAKFSGKGLRIAVVGRIQTGSYTNKDGQRVYTTDVVVEQVEFAESKASGQDSSYQQAATAPSSAVGDGFMNIPEGLEEELPFN